MWMTQWNVHTQNYLGQSTSLTLWSQQHNRRDLTLKYIAHISNILVKYFNLISYSDPSYTCTNSQYLSHITSTNLMILTLAMAASQKQMWGHKPQHSHTKLNNNYTGFIHTEPMSCLPGMLDQGLTILTILLTCTKSGSMAACWQE